MRYFVTNNIELFESNSCKIITVQESLQLLQTMQIVGIDTETLGLDVFTKTLLTLQLGDYNNQVMIDCTTIDINLYKGFLESDRLFIFCNAKFDLKFLYHKRIVPKRVYDVMLVEKLLWLGYPAGIHKASLQSLAYNYLNVTLDKSVRGKIIYQGITEEVIVYGCNDVRYLEEIMNKQSIYVKEKELEKAVEVENNFVKVLAYIEYSGIKLDEAKWQDKMKKDLKRLEVATDTLNNWIKNKAKTDKYFTKFLYKESQGDLWNGYQTEAKCTINWNSSKQLIPIFEHLGYKLLVKDKATGLMKKSVEAKVLDVQKDVSDILEPYTEYTSQSKLVSTYGQSFLDQINPVTNRIHTNFNQLMDTSRLSCGGKDKYNKVEYVNIQNLPSDPETRASFVPEKGYLLIDCDYSAQEDLVFTELSQEPKLIDFYNDAKRNRDGHSFVAKICFPAELDQYEEGEVKHMRPDLRSLAKKAKFSIKYLL